MPTSKLIIVKPPDLKNLYNAISSLFSIEGPAAPRVTNGRASDPHQVSIHATPPQAAVPDGRPGTSVPIIISQ